VVQSSGIRAALIKVIDGCLLNAEIKACQESSLVGIKTVSNADICN